MKFVGCAPDTMRVLHLIDSGGLYGAEQVLLALASEQQLQGLQPTILSAGEPGEPAKPLEAEANERGIPVVPWRIKPGLNLREGRRILRWAHAEGFDVLHSHGYKFNILGALCQRRRDRLPTVATVHGHTGTRRLSRLWVYQQLDLFALRRLDAVVLVSPTMQTLPGIRRLPNERRYVIANGLGELPPEAHRLPEEVAAFRERFEACWAAIGRLSAEKGHEVLVQAMAEVAQRSPRCGVVIFGDGPCASDLASLAREYGIQDQILFAGYRPHAASLLSHFDALIMPSHSEGLPMTVLEAMRASVPVIATRVGGMVHALAGEGPVDPHQLVPPNDSHRLATALDHLKDDPQWARALADRGRERFSSDYSAKAMAAGYTQCYANVLQRNQSSPV